MSLYALLAVAIALGIDAASMAIGIGLSGIAKIQIYIVSGTVAIFHVIMPLLGLYSGHILGELVGPLASLIGAAILIGIGGHTLWEAIKSKRGNNGHEDSAGFNAEKVASPVGLILMAGSVSLDALTVGFSLGTMEVDITTAVIVMGIVAGIMTAGGLIFGKLIGKVVGDWAEIFAGAILLLIGLKLLFM